MNNTIIKNFKKCMKRYLCFCFSIVLLILFFSGKIFAETDETALIGVQTEIPDIENKSDNIISPYDLGVPSKDSIYDLNKANKIEGYAENSYLYSNKHFYGVATITMTITNYSDKDLDIILYKNGLIDKKISEFTIPANSNYYVSIENLDKSTYYYFRFSHPSDFSGYVTGYTY